VPSIIEQIQRDALDPKVRVSDLLRRVKLAAVKLDLGAVEDWVENELNGYEDQPVPEYRAVTGVPMSRNPYLGWQPIGGAIDDMSSKKVGVPISALEETVNAPAGSQVQFPYSDEVVERLNKLNGTRGWLAALVVDRTAMVPIVDHVRNLVLDWACKMEKAGIVGTEFDFNMTEKAKAQSTSTTINIGHIEAFAGNLGAGNVSGNVTMRDLDLNRVGDVTRQLLPHVADLAAAGADGPALKASLDQLKAELQKPTPAPSVLRGLLVDVRNAISGAAGNLIATGATTLLNQLLATGVPPVPGGV
jgi:hypothetical protein